MKSHVTCSVVIYSDKEKRIRTCGARATHNIVVRGDTLFGVCSRHDARLKLAMPEWAA